jgi:putative inorganic carbon (hco3(-)) transporter
VRRRLTRVALAVGLVGAALFVTGVIANLGLTPYAILAVALLVLFVLAIASPYLYWNADPAYLFCGAIALSPLSGNWAELGIPGAVAPDRLLLIAAIVAVLIRTPGGGERPDIRIAPVHYVMLAAILFAAVSAAIAGSLFERAAFFKLLEPYGLLPFAAFLTAPLVFRTEKQRNALLATLVVLGGYLALTALFETLKVDALVFPKYIVDPNYGIHADRARGPFVEAVTNGFAMFVCAVAAAIAYSRWRVAHPVRASLALTVVAMSAVGILLCLERSVWIGAGLAAIVALLANQRARRLIPFGVLSVTALVGLALLVVPGLSDRVSTRASDERTIWDRRNLNQAALNMLEARPLLGFGWFGFPDNSVNYLEQSHDYPLTISRATAVHNVFLTYAVELGLLGFLLWLGAMAVGVGQALGSRGPPDTEQWRIGLLAVAVCFAVVTNFVPPSVFPNLALWLWAGVVWSSRYSPTRRTGPAVG